MVIARNPVEPCANPKCGFSLGDAVWQSFRGVYCSEKCLREVEGPKDFKVVEGEHEQE